ncbi:MAG: hypothetical protein JO021_10415 [Alphaproteobacteria bacterium]|nr:hypothetical protein [Alphaproteobacteria bacterium]
MPVSGSELGALGAVLLIDLVLAGDNTSVVLTGVAYALIANLLNKYPWIAYAGLAVITYVAADMIWRGANEVGSAI